MTVADVLVVDDESAIVSLLAAILEEEGYRVTGAPNGRDALRMAIASVPHLVLTDIHMPLMDGIELARRLRAHARTEHVPILLMSANASPRLAGSGACGFIAKPFDFARVLRLVAHHVAA